MVKKILSELKGKKFNTLFKQFNMLIINFGDEITDSFHINCLVRIINGNRLLLTSADEYFTADGLQKSDDDYNTLEQNEIINDPNSLLAKNIEKVNKILRGEEVTRIKVSPCKDVYIYFANDVIIQILPDCLEKCYEYYRYIKFVPCWDEKLDNFKSVHYVALNNQGEIKINIEK